MQMVKAFRIAVAWVAIASVAAPAVAGDLQASVSKVVESAEQTAPPASSRSIPKGYLWPGAGLFVGGMAVAIHGFLNNRNGQFPEFGEADSTNVKMGAAGLAAAFGGGLLLFLGKERGKHAASLTAGPGRIVIAKRLDW